MVFGPTDKAATIAVFHTLPTVAPLAVPASSAPSIASEPLAWGFRDGGALALAVVVGGMAMTIRRRSF